MDSLVNDHGMHSYDCRWEGKGRGRHYAHPEIETMIYGLAQAWATLHPHATLSERERIVCRLATVIGVTVIREYPTKSDAQTPTGGSHG